MARAMGVSRASLYYRAKQPAKDWALKVRIEETLREHPSYGSRRLAQALGMSRERARQGKVKAYPLSGTRRHVWRFRQSDLDAMLIAPSVPCRKGAL